MIVYDYDSNAIIAAPLKNRSDQEMIAAFKPILLLLRQRGVRPRVQRLDNEASMRFKAFLTEQEIDFQLAPPHMHRRNSRK